MRLEPLQNWIIGRVAITKTEGTIVLADPTKNVTKFILIDEVSPEAASKGFKVGQIVMPKAMNNIFLRGGTYHRVTCSIDELVCRVHDEPIENFVGSDNKPLTAVDKAAA